MPCLCFGEQQRITCHEQYIWHLEFFQVVMQLTIQHGNTSCVQHLHALCIHAHLHSMLYDGSCPAKRQDMGSVAGFAFTSTAIASKVQLDCSRSLHIQQAVAGLAKACDANIQSAQFHLSGATKKAPHEQMRGQTPTQPCIASRNMFPFIGCHQEAHLQRDLFTQEQEMVCQAWDSVASDACL